MPSLARASSLLSLVLALGGVARAQDGPAVELPDPTGVWAVEGGGTVTMAPAARGDGRFHLAWDTPTGKYEGIGLLRGTELIVGWGRGAAGVMLARREGAGWAGVWTTPGQADLQLGEETWPGADLLGAREVSGKNPRGTTYRGRVVAEQRGDVVHVRWTTGDGEHAGVGLALDAERVAIGFGAGNFGVIVYDLSGGDDVTGRWCAQADERFGVEKLRRRSRGPTGVWTVEAGGTLTVRPAPRGDRRYLLAWDTPGEAYEGIGLLRGGRLLVGWGQGAAGVMIARRDGDGWTGEWVTPALADERLGAETWAGAALEGEHAVTGTNPTGTAYRGRVVVERKGDVLHLAWTVGTEEHVGVAIPLGDDRLAIAFGRGAFGVAVYDLSGGDAVEGRWCARKGERVGAERLTRSR